MLATDKPVLATSSSKLCFVVEICSLAKCIMLYQNVGQTSRALGSYRRRRTLTSPVMLYHAKQFKFYTGLTVSQVTHLIT